MIKGSLILFFFIIVFKAVQGRSYFNAFKLCRVIELFVTTVVFSLQKIYNNPQCHFYNIYPAMLYNNSNACLPVIERHIYQCMPETEKIIFFLNILEVKCPDSYSLL